jgi:hypothetical protein
MSGASTAISRLQRRVEARVLQQAAQLVVQHLQLAQAGMAGMHLQAGVVAAQAVAQLARGQRTAVEQIALQAMQQAVGQAAFVQGRPGVLLRIGIGGDFAGRVHHLVPPSTAMKSRPAAPQASSRRFSPAASPRVRRRCAGARPASAGRPSTTAPG